MDRRCFLRFLTALPGLAFLAGTREASPKEGSKLVENDEELGFSMELPSPAPGTRVTIPADGRYLVTSTGPYALTVYHEGGATRLGPGERGVFPAPKPDDLRFRFFRGESCGGKGGLGHAVYYETGLLDLNPPPLLDLVEVNLRHWKE